MIDEYRALEKEFGNEVSAINFVEGKVMGAPAHYQNEDNIIEIGSVKAGGIANRSDDPVLNAKVVMAHEYGHSFPVKIKPEINVTKMRREGYAEKYIERAVEYHNKLVSEYNNDPNKALNDRMNNLYKEYCKNEKRNGSVNGRISKYAFEDVREFAAEAFALNRIRGGNSNNYYVKEVMSILKQYPKIKRNR